MRTFEMRRWCAGIVPVRHGDTNRTHMVSAQLLLKRYRQRLGTGVRGADQRDKGKVLQKRGACASSSCAPWRLSAA